jgi:hypothetical protein
MSATTAETVAEKQELASAIEQLTKATSSATAAAQHLEQAVKSTPNATPATPAQSQKPKE